jgi:hypothetical protein
LPGHQRIQDRIECLGAIDLVRDLRQVLLDVVVFLVVSEHAVDNTGQLMGGSPLLLSLFLVFLASSLALDGLLALVIGGAQLLQEFLANLGEVMGSGVIKPCFLHCTERLT